MDKYIANSKGDIVKHISAIPKCGEDFCDACGDCLHCYGEDECLSSGYGCHFWVEYEQDTKEE
jgi:hypothetical protein